MKKQCQKMQLLWCFTLVACTQTPSEEQQVVASSPTNPEVVQRAITQRTEEVEPGDPAYRPPRHQPVETLQVPTGSLFNPGRSVGLYQLNRSYRVGDMILVELDEKTSSQKSLKYDEEKSSNFEIKPLTVNAGPIHISDNDLNVDHAQDGEFKSSAASRQTNAMSGKITVYVTEVLPNDNLVVSGEKWITMNQGKEYIRFSGEIRKQDITANNTVSSSKVGNALIEYSGKGELQDNQQRSILDKLFSILG